MDDNIIILASICLTFIITLCIIEYFKTSNLIDGFNGTAAKSAQALLKSCNSDSDCPIRFKCDARFCKDKRPGKR
jgi:hypothetical protein